MALSRVVSPCWSQSHTQALSTVLGAAGPWVQDSLFTEAATAASCCDALTPVGIRERLGEVPWGN